MEARTHRTGTGTVRAHDQGAQLTEWRVGGVPVIWVSALARYAEGQPIRGGVPVCWPWFGPGRSGDLSPAHGFARTAPWRLVDEVVDDAGVRLAWELSSADTAGRSGTERFPHTFRARVEVRVTDRATVSLTVRNEDSAAFDYEAALHTYLHVGDIRRVRLTGLDGAHYFDKVLRAGATQHGDLVCTGETDRVHTSDGPVAVHDPVLGRTLTVEKASSPHTVVWNPWAEKAAAMEDFGDREWTEMVCVEAAAVGDGAVRLEPGAEHTLSTTVRVGPLHGS
ncbi:D-hexose-6-phosphate mutarotase [Ornithinimicrobium cavernae]|uniref:D-hexose-6-phosphate mutarotase n=1 Tax=Ornithinimicrobium cavernae TaxID=2666047 RepID=UPI000D69FE75|nr:D-hexose-6-phosphate mutarotase [Ornithinimicrobium cavernae]